MRNTWIAVFCLSLLAISTNAGTGLLCLGYTEPALAWTDALPVGNGSMGAMVFGGVATERTMKEI
jgi:alpha-L-fucosidase 2